MARRISKKLLSEYPKPVAEEIKAIANRFNVKSATVKTVTPDHKFYVGEGYHFFGYKADGSGASFEAVAEHNLGAANVTHRIGDKFTMPPSTFLVEVSYYTKYWMTVYAVNHLLEG